MVKLGAPLFILRQEAEKDLFGVLDGIAKLGYEGVEFLGFFGREPSAIRRHLDALDMVAVGNHVGLDALLEDPARVLEDHKTLGCRYITIGWPSRELTPADAGFDAALERLGKAAAMARDAGLVPLFHNHDNELAGPRPMVDTLLSHCADAGLRFEPDLGWIAFAGKDPADYLRRYRAQSPVIHLKDIYAADLAKVGRGNELAGIENDPDRGGFAFRPTGYGMMNYPVLMPLCLACAPEWFIIDHDCAYGRSAYDDLGLSLEYVRTLLMLTAG